MQDGEPRYVTAVSTTDVHEGWREHRSDGGVIIDVPSGEIVARGLSMPHSPRLCDGQLYALNSGAGELVKVDPAHRFIGLDGYQKVIDSGVDVVILTTPPGFRPQHLKAAVAANKHIFCEKPVATDAPGIRSVLESVEEAKKKKLALEDRLSALEDRIIPDIIA